MDINEFIDEYAAGPQKLRDAIAGMTTEQIDASPVPGKWSTRQVICHLADFEPVYADRMKHVIAEDQPSFAGGFHQQFADHLAYDQRDIEEEIRLMEVTRSQMARILRSLPPEAFERTGIHSVDGAMTLRTLLERISADDTLSWIKSMAGSSVSVSSSSVFTSFAPSPDQSPTRPLQILERCRSWSDYLPT